MKNAKARDSGIRITADKFAPEIALCPYCGHEVTLRSRKIVLEKNPIYYWRHKRKLGRGCPRRHSPVV